MEAVEKVAKQLEDRGIACKCNEALKEHTSFRIGGPARLFVQPKNTKELVDVLAGAKTANVPYFVLGKGTNVLFEDEGYNGLIIELSLCNSQIEISDAEIIAGAGAELSVVCTTARDAALGGLEFAYGIPGSVGGAVYMNAGAYGGEMKQVLKEVCFLDENFNVRALPANELELGYRTSAFHSHAWIILSATFACTEKETMLIEAEMQDLWTKRKDKQPLELPSAGSAFKRPEGAFAGALIDQCGLRGYRVGDAAISEKHCGFIVNLGQATCQQVLQLAEEVAQKVQQQTGYVLEKEIRVISSPK